MGLCLILWTFSGQTTSAAGARGERRRREAPAGGPGVLPRKIFENGCTLVHFQSILRQDGAHFVIDNRVTFSYKIPYIWYILNFSLSIDILKSDLFGV